MSYQCHNRAPFKESMIVQEGWFMDGVTRAPKMKSSPFRMATDCRYQENDQYADPQCVGCQWKTKQEQKDIA